LIIDFEVEIQGGFVPKGIKIFLAHVSEDKRLVRKLYWKLKEQGLDPWLDEEDLLPGQNWRAEIPKAIRECDFFIACLSKHSIHKQGYVNKEFRMALDVYAEKPSESIYLIPLKLNACDVPDIQLPKLEISLRDFHWLDYWKTDGLMRLLNVLDKKEESSVTSPKQGGQAIDASVETFIPKMTKQDSSPAQHMPSWVLKVSVTGALVFITVLLALAVFIPQPSNFQMFVFRIVLALSAAAFGVTIPGFLKIKLSLSTQGLIHFGGAIALFLLIYQLNPPQLITPDQPSHKIITPKPPSAGEDKKMPISLRPSGPKLKMTNSLGMEFVYIPPGTFMMGSPGNEEERDHDEIQHRVTLTQGFYLQTTEVTQGQWQAMMGDNPSHFKDCGNNCPVESVSWIDAQKIITKLNQKEKSDLYRLPTEAEWEYTARAGTFSPFSFGNRLSTDQANYNGNYPYGNNPKGIYRGKTTPAGSFQANAWGVYDMHGNVWEWCADWYGDYPSKGVTDPQGPSSGSSRVLRGGSWILDSRYLRSACRFGHRPITRSGRIGFRLARGQQVNQQ
jgi:formylglycine-generating enzyme required for sulfatase activity